MTDQRIKDLLAEADRHRADAAEHMRRAAELNALLGEDDTDEH